MNGKVSQTESRPNSAEPTPLRSLNWHQIQMIDEALSAVGPYAEIRLIMAKDRLSFAVTKIIHGAPESWPGSREQDRN